MNLEDQVPVLVLNILEADITQDTGVVDQNVDATKCLDGSLDDLVTIFDGVIIGNCLSTVLLDLIDYYIGGLVNEDKLALGNFATRVMTSQSVGKWLGPTFVELPSPLKEPPKSLTTTLAPRDPKKVAYAFPRPPPAPVTTTTWPSNRNWPAILVEHA